jgi:hypothetical protein
MEQKILTKETHEFREGASKTTEGKKTEIG